jgi:hypothetical protein
MGRFSSAIYFIGENMTPSRILDIIHTKKVNSENARLRQRFVSYLNTHMHTSGLTNQQQQFLSKIE